MNLFLRMVLAESDDVVQRVFAHLDAANVSPDDRTLIDADVRHKAQLGWTSAEIWALIRNTEEVNPDIDEDRACAKMQRVKTRVELRLKLTAKLKAAMAALNAGDRKPLLQLQQEVIDGGNDLTIEDAEVFISTTYGERIVTFKR